MQTDGEDKTRYITFEDGLVTVGGRELPGLVVQVTVADQVKFDEARSDGQSGKKKTPMGFEDSTINIDMELLTDEAGDCYDKLTEINGVFKDVGPKAAPKILDVVNRHLRARGVNQVVFSGLSSRETNQDDMILAALTFTEHLPPVTTAENRVVGGALKDQRKKAEAAKNDPAAKNAAPAANPKTVTINTN